MRRGPGLAAVDRNKVAKQRFAAKGTELADAEISQMVKQLDSFKNFLESFAAKHQADIKKNPEFRQHFQKLCSQIGVDPLASSKGFWAEILGVGDFYYELGVQITEVCLATKANNGGLISLDDLLRLVLKGRGRTRQDVSEYLINSSTYLKKNSLVSMLRKLRIRLVSFFELKGSCLPCGGQSSARADLLTMQYLTHLYISRDSNS